MLAKIEKKKEAKLAQQKLKGNQKTNPNSKEVHTHEHKRPGLTQCGDHSRRLVNMK